jgi:hypothetical protein
MPFPPLPFWMSRAQGKRHAKKEEITNAELANPKEWQRVLGEFARCWLRKLTKTFRGYVKVSRRAERLADCSTSGRRCKA